MHRPAQLACVELGVGSLSLVERTVTVDVDVGSQLAVEPVDPGKNSLAQRSRAERALVECLPELSERELRRVDRRHVKQDGARGTCPRA